MPSGFGAGCAAAATRASRSFAGQFQHDFPFLVAHRRYRQARLADQLHLREPRLGLDARQRHWLKRVYGLDPDRNPVRSLGSGSASRATRMMPTTALSDML